MIEKFKKSLDQGGEYAVLLTDLIKAFDCLPHDLIIAKLHAYGFDKSSLRLLHSYLTDRYQRVKINNSYSLWSLIKHGVPQGSILGPILFNIFLCDMFFMVDNIDIASYADDNTPYSVGKSQCDLETKLEKAPVKIFKRFNENGLKANQEKCHFLSSLDINMKFSLLACILENSNSQKPLGVTIDRKLNFNEHVTNLCDKASKKIQALARIFPYIPQTQKRLLMNAYFMSQFGYCPLVWMNHSRTLNNRINGLHKRALSLVYNDFSSSFSELLEKGKSVTIHHRNLQTLAYEIFKVKKNMAPEILTEIFPQKESNYSLKNSTTLQGRCIKTVMFG